MRSGSRRAASDAFYLITIAFLIVIIGVFAILYFKATHEVNTEGAAVVGVVTGMDHPLPKATGQEVYGYQHLPLPLPFAVPRAPRPRPARGDLIADTPTDAAKQVDPESAGVFIRGGSSARTHRAVWKDFTEHLAKVDGEAGGVCGWRGRRRSRFGSLRRGRFT